MGSLLERFLGAATKILDVIGGAALTFMMLLTVADVILRATGRPLVGTFEVVALALSLVIGFTIPKVSLDRGHIRVDLVMVLLGRRSQALLNTFTRLICLALFAIITYNLFLVAGELRASGEVSPTIQLPAYPFAYGVAVCCAVECLVFILDICKIWTGRYE
ncbi:MAG: TRAP transporter small permease [Desulfobacterota bacterium]|jgi:TRAP-type C4-dicarboxylate transport system permease small subunit|nr:TRAP transporter small permease [Thermodesulfobacteriota bacterium]